MLSLGQTCFTGDTLVSAEDGQKRIDEIEVGDKVWAYDIYTGKTELKEVLTVYVHDQDEILHLKTTAGDIDTTSNHPFYVMDKGWVAAGDLENGDEVYLIDGDTAVVTGSELEKLDEAIKVYNLEVEENHTYFVNKVLVHNEYDWSSKEVRDAAKQLKDEKKTVTVSTKSQAEELFLGLYQGDGYHNTTGWNPIESSTWYNKKGHYHWDISVVLDEKEGKNVIQFHKVGSQDGTMGHLQIHDFDAKIIRIFIKEIVVGE